MGKRNARKSFRKRMREKFWHDKVIPAIWNAFMPDITRTVLGPDPNPFMMYFPDNLKGKMTGKTA